MKSKFVVLFIIVFAMTLVAQSPKPYPPVTWWYKVANWVESGSITMTYKTLTSPTLTTPATTGISTFDSTITAEGTGKAFKAGSYSSRITLTPGATNEMVTIAGLAEEDDFAIGYGSYIRTTGEDGKGFGASFLVEATNTTGTPTLEGLQSMAFLGSVGGTEAAILKTRGGDATAGMYAIWAKTGANNNAVFASGSRTVPLWVDNQCGGTHSGEEYGIFASTGMSQPDAFIGFETTSRGWDALFYFDETSYDQEPVVAADITGGSKSYYLRVNVNGTMYGIQLYAE